MHPLPTELWEAIFVHCLPNVNALSGDPGNICVTPGVAPLLLCRVCMLWRQISISLPYLWVSLPVFVSRGSACPSPDLVRLWLARSGNLALSLSLYQQNESNANCVVTEEVLRVFKHHTSRWYSIHFNLSRNTRLPILDPRAAPMLETFEIQSVGVDALTSLGVVPRLVHVHVSHIPDLSLSGDNIFPVPWSQLTSLTLDSVPSVDSSFRILGMCPNLGKCAFTIDPHHGVVLLQPLVHVMLKSLILNIGHDHLSTFLEHSILPQLSQVAVYSNDVAEWPQATFIGFLEKSSCHLRQLEVYNPGMSSAHFFACVHHPCLQSLEELVLDDFRDWTKEPFVIDNILKAISCSFQMNEIFNTDAEEPLEKISKCLLPRLEKLVLLSNHLVGRDGAFADMVGSRLRYPNKVQELRWLECELSVDHIEDLSRLHEFQRQGLLECLRFASPRVA